MRSPVAELLADLGRAFEALGFRWYLFGAQAAIVYGVARLTADVDVTARVPAGHGGGWVGTVETHGFEQRFSDRRLLTDARVVPLVHGRTGLPVDIVLAGPGLEDEFIERATIHTIEGVGVPVIDVSDLVVLKVLAGRPKDIDDLAALLRIHGDGIDLPRVRTLLRALETALGQSDLLPTLERLRSGTK